MICSYAAGTTGAGAGAETGAGATAEARSGVEPAPRAPENQKAAAATSAYGAGVAAGAAGAAAAPVYAMGVSYAALPAGCITPNVQGQAYYLCGNTWFLPSYF